MTAMANLTRLPRNVIHDVLENKKIDGIIYIPKEYGMFICE